MFATRKPLWVALVGAIFALACDRAPGADRAGGSSGPSSTASTAGVDRPTTALGVALPPACALHEESHVVGGEGASTARVVAACTWDRDALTAWLETERSAGRMERHDDASYRAGRVRLRGYDVDAPPPRTKRPPPSARSLLELVEQHAPSPCPPCEAGDAPLPGCRCPP